MENRNDSNKVDDKNIPNQRMQARDSNEKHICKDCLEYNVALYIC